jgi:hypothetical protein
MAYLNKKAVLRAQLDSTVHVTGYDTIYCNARFVAALRETTGLKPRWVAFAPVPELKMAVEAAGRLVKGAVPVKWAPNEQGCMISFGPVLAEYELLAVAFGRIRKIPFVVEDGRLVLDCSQGELDDSMVVKRRQAMLERLRRMTPEEREAAIRRARRRSWKAAVKRWRSRRK